MKKGTSSKSLASLVSLPLNDSSNSLKSSSIKSSTKTKTTTTIVNTTTTTRKNRNSSVQVLSQKQNGRNNMNNATNNSFLFFQPSSSSLSSCSSSSSLSSSASFSSSSSSSSTSIMVASQTQNSTQVINYLNSKTTLPPIGALLPSFNQEVWVKLCAQVIEAVYYPDRFHRPQLENVLSQILWNFTSAQYYFNCHPNNAIILCLVYLMKYKHSIRNTNLSCECAFAVALMLAHKFLDDRPRPLTFWSQTTGVPGVILRSSERVLLSAMGYELFVSLESYNRWFDLLTAKKTNALPTLTSKVTLPPILNQTQTPFLSSYSSPEINDTFSTNFFQNDQQQKLKEKEKRQKDVYPSALPLGNSNSILSIL